MKTGQPLDRILIFKDVISAGDKLKLFFNPENFFTTVTATLTHSDKRCYHVSNLIWEGIDYLCVKNFLKLLKNQNFVVSADFKNENDLTLKLTFSPVSQPVLIAQDKMSVGSWGSGFLRVIDYLTHALQKSSINPEELVYTESASSLPLASLIHQSLKHKTISVVILSSDQQALRRHFLQTFALNCLKNYQEGMPLVLYCPLMLYSRQNALIRETLSFYGLNDQVAFLKKHPLIWVIEDVDEVFQKKGGGFNILTSIWNDFRDWNCHFIVGTNPKYSSNSYFDPITRIRVMGPRDPCNFYLYNMSATPKKELKSNSVNSIPKQSFFNPTPSLLADKSETSVLQISN